VWPHRRIKARRQRKAAIRKAAADARESLARAEAEHASEARALRRDALAAARNARLAASLREIRRENHFAAAIAEAFRGEP